MKKKSMSGNDKSPGFPQRNQNYYHQKKKGRNDKGNKQCGNYLKWDPLGLIEIT